MSGLLPETSRSFGESENARERRKVDQQRKNMNWIEGTHQLGFTPEVRIEPKTLKISGDASNDTVPPIEHPKQLKRFRLWEQGFELYFRGAKLEQVKVSHHKTSETIQDGWRAGEAVDNLRKDDESVNIFKKAKIRFNPCN